MRILLFGDNLGIPQILRHLDPRYIAGIVGAAIRPQYWDTLKALAQTLQVPFLVQPAIKNDAINGDEYLLFKDSVGKLRPDIIWVNSYSMIVRPEILAIPKYGGINIHGALLPQYRGCNPLQWAILNQEIETGVTLHEMTAVLDQGKIIDRRVVPLRVDDTWITARARIAEATEKLIATNLPKILSGCWQSYGQNESLAKHYLRRTPEDGVFSWEQPVHKIYDLNRSLLPPLPGAFYHTQSGQKVILDKYYTPTEITALKFGSVGGKLVESEHIRLHLEKRADIRGDSDDTSLNFVMEDNKKQNSFGECRLKNINWHQREAELEINMTDSFVQMDTMKSELLQLIVRFGFEELNLWKIWSTISSVNSGIVLLYQGCGFQREELNFSANALDANPTVEFRMSILANAYE